MAKNSDIDFLLSDEDNGLFNLDDVTEKLYRRFGGAEGIAQVIWEVFHEASAGSPTKERIAMGLLKLSFDRNKAGMDQDIGDTSAMSEDDLLVAMDLLEKKRGEAASS